MVKKLVKHGNSMAIVIEKPILDLLNIKKDTPLTISTDGNNLIISPSLGDEKNIDKHLKEINKNFGKTLAKLSK